MKPGVRYLHHELPLLATYGPQYKELLIIVSDWNHDAIGKKKKSLHGLIKDRRIYIIVK